MNIVPVTDFSFAPYGKVLTGLDCSALLDVLREQTEKPLDRVLYVPSDEKMEALPIFSELRDHAYGGMPIQIGYCNGHNSALNCLEYHRGCEINIAADDVVLLVAQSMAIQENKLNAGIIKAFRLPAGTAVLLYETTLHYAPCSTTAEGFRVIIALPRGTNGEKPDITPETDEDKLLWGRNKWLIAHPEAPEAGRGAVAGIVGKNLEVPLDKKPEA